MADKRAAWQSLMQTHTVFRTYMGVVYPWNCDHMGHMNVSHYVGKFDQATWHLLAAVGLSGREMIKRNICLVAGEQALNYYKELLPGDLVHIDSVFLSCGNKSARFLHLMTGTDATEPVAMCEIAGIQIDRDSRQATAMAPDIRARITEAANGGG